MPNNEIKAVRLSTDQIKGLKDTQKMLPDVKKEVAALKKLGMDTRALEDKLQWSEEAANTLLDVFGKE